MPFGPKEPHDPLIIRLGEWLRAKSLRSIMIEHKAIEMKA